MTKRSWLIGAFVLSLIVLIGLNWYWEFFVPMGKTSIVLTLIAIGFSALIAITQQIQLKKLERIGKETGETARQIKTETIIDETVRKFFILPKGNEVQYKCIFPAFYNSRPLPFITAGDYHALQVLVTLLGDDRVELYPQVDSAESKGKLEQDNVIYLCTPSANPTLHELLPPYRLSDTGDVSLDDHGETIDMPCWFGEDYRDSAKRSGDDREEPIKKIVVLNSESPAELESPSEEHYIAARKAEQGVPYVPQSKFQKDYGILARITREGKKKIIIAGIHQYGTWIVAEFFARLSRGEAVDHREVFLDEDDFVAVIWGDFDTKKLAVVRSGVEEEYVWRKANTWEQIPPKGMEV